MVIVAFTSFQKSWTGKSSLAVLSALLASERPVCILDCEGGSSRALQVSGHEGITEVLRGSVDLKDAVLEIEVRKGWRLSRKFGGRRLRAWILPKGREEAPNKNLAGVALHAARVINNYADVAIDLPPYRDGSFDSILSEIDSVAVIVNPDPLSVRAIVQYEGLGRILNGKATIKPVLNKVRDPEHESYVEELEQLGDPLIVPFDPAFAAFPRRITKVLAGLREETLEALRRLSGQLFSGS